MLWTCNFLLLPLQFFLGAGALNSEKKKINFLQSLILKVVIFPSQLPPMLLQGLPAAVGITVLNLNIDPIFLVFCLGFFFPFQ